MALGDAGPSPEKKFFEREGPMGCLVGISAVVGIVLAFIRHAIALVENAGGLAKLRLKDALAQACSDPFTYVLFALTVGGMVIAVFRYLHGSSKDKAEVQHRDPTDLRGCLHAIVAAIDGVSSRSGKGAVRATVWQVRGQAVVQLIDYVPVRDPHRKHGRRMRLTEGIVGWVVQNREAKFHRRTAKYEEGVRREMRSKWKMGDNSVSRAKEGVYDRAGIPVFADDGAISGVVYIDSTEDGYFEGKVVQDLAVAAVQGLATYVRERYH